ncbi:MAG: thiosulfate sulfurtransferase GlpE [Dysgonomonas sp.]
MYKRISVSQAREILDGDGESVLLDIRDYESYNQSHASRAIHVNQDVLSHFIYNTPKDVSVLVICYHGNSSQSLAQYLSSHGFMNVYSVDGGYEAWIDSE